MSTLWYVFFAADKYCLDEELTRCMFSSPCLPPVRHRQQAYRLCAPRRPECELAKRANEYVEERPKFRRLKERRLGCGTHTWKEGRISIPFELGLLTCEYEVRQIRKCDE